jgi:hypothetical protein
MDAAVRSSRTAPSSFPLDYALTHYQSRHILFAAY